MPAIEDRKILRVANATPIAELGSAIFHAIAADGDCWLRAIGAGSVNQTVKAIIVAQGYAAQAGLSLVNRAGFQEIDMPSKTQGQSEKRTSVLFHVFTI